jgi:glycosyltransferase involved in cell wall biosynthesis
VTKHISVIQRRMTEYRIPLFEQLRDTLKRQHTTLTVVYGTPKENEKLRKDEAKLSWGYAIPTRYFDINNIQLVWQKIPSTILRQQDLIIMPHESNLLMNYYLLFRRRFNKTKLAFWGHGGNFQSLSDGYRARIKSWSTRQVDWWFAYTSLSVARVLENGFPEDRITRLNNSIDTGKLIEWKNDIRSDELEAARRALGFEGNNVGVFIGSLHAQRRLDFLFSSVSELRKRLQGFELIIIGDGELREKVKEFIEENAWAKWTGALHSREKVLHMSLGKVILNPGLVGLNILDSLALGIPMITTDCGLHSPEIAYLESGRNGIMTRDNLNAYVSAVENLLRNDQLRKQMASACAEDAQCYSLDKMVGNFCEGIVKALDAEPRYHK